MGSEQRNETNNDTRPTILLTGFGPFAKYEVNPAWQALQVLEKRSNELPSQVKFVFREIPVGYETVTETMPRWWNEIQPVVIIHVGTGIADGSIHVEKRAYNRGYCCKDVENRVPCDNCYEENGPPTLDTSLDVDHIIEELNRNIEQLKGLRPAKLSTNPGRYLCGFIYYQSLLRYSRRSLFVHVPPIDDCVVTDEKLAEGLKLIISAVIKQLGEKL